MGILILMDCQEIMERNMGRKVEQYEKGQRAFGAVWK